MPATRNPANIPFASSSVWNIGIGSNAQWSLSTDVDAQQLHSLNGAINAGAWGQPIYFGTASDPLVTVTNTDPLYPVPTQQIHIPANALAAIGTDAHMTFYDATQPGKMWSYFGCSFVNGRDVTGGITTALGGVWDTTGDGLTSTVTPGGYDFAAGVITDYDVSQAAINHMVRIAFSQDALKSPGADWMQNIPWPNNREDYWGARDYTGSIVAGSTFGIPMSVNLNSLGLSQGGMMLAKALQNYGGLWRDSGGTNQVTFYSTPENENNPLIQQMRADMAKIVPVIEVLRNQGPNSVNGGGTPVVPPLAPVSLGAGTTQPPVVLPPVVLPPVVLPPTPITFGTGPDSLVFQISEDAYANGDAMFTVSVDGKQIGGTFTAAASHAAGQEQAVTLNGDFAPGTHDVAVTFLNDAWGGTPSTDRNLYVDSITYNGLNTNQSASLIGSGAHHFTVSDGTSVPSPSTTVPPAVVDSPVVTPPATGTPRAQLLAYLQSLSGNHTLIGQTSNDGGGEFTADTQAFGFSPAIMFQDPWAAQWAGNAPFWASFMPAALAHAKAGGIVGMSLMLPNPVDHGPSMNGPAVDPVQLLTPGSALNNSLNGELDQAAGLLQQFKDAGDAVLTRFMLELDGSWFWWGAGHFSTAQQTQLFRYIVNYLRVTKGLDNLVTTFAVNGGPADYQYPGDDVVDIVGIDAYTDNLAGDKAVYDKLVAQAPTKLFALTEFGSGDPSAVDPSYDLNRLKIDIQSAMPRAVYANFWPGWGPNLVTNGKAAMSDPFWINKSQVNLGSIGGGGTTTPPVDPTPPTPAVDPTPPTPPVDLTPPTPPVDPAPPTPPVDLTPPTPPVDPAPPTPAVDPTPPTPLVDPTPPTPPVDPAPPTPAVDPTPITFGSGPDNLLLRVSEDAYGPEHAKFTVSIDGKQIGGAFTAAAGQEQSVTLNGDFGRGTHDVSVSFLNDARGGTPSTDRNLDVDPITYNGAVTNRSEHLAGSGVRGFTVGDSTPVPLSAPSPTEPPPATPITFGSGPDSLVLQVSEDADASGDGISNAKSDAAFTVSVDGKQIGGTFIAAASHAAGQDQAVTLNDYFGHGTHSVSVNFLNDAWGGKPSADRNLYVDSVTYKGLNTNQAGSLAGEGSEGFPVSGGTVCPVAASQAPDKPIGAGDATPAGSGTNDGATVDLTAPGGSNIALGSSADRMNFLGTSSVAPTVVQPTAVNDVGASPMAGSKDLPGVIGGSGSSLHDFAAALGNILPNAQLPQNLSDRHGASVLSFGETNLPALPGLAMSGPDFL